MMSVSCITAHPDDEMLGVRGSPVRHAANNEDMYACILSDGVTSRYDDLKNEIKEIELRRDRVDNAYKNTGAAVGFHEFIKNYII
jgi:LmbE family N-acetylglucosaminyl deacetylase